MEWGEGIEGRDNSNYFVLEEAFDIIAHVCSDYTTSELDILLITYYLYIRAGHLRQLHVGAEV